MPELVILVLAIGAFWFIAMRPARNQQRTMRTLQNELSVGDEVVISAGIFGVVTEIEDSRVHLEIAPGTVITVARQVVVRRATETEAPAEVAPEPQAAVDESADATNQTQPVAQSDLQPDTKRDEGNE